MDSTDLWPLLQPLLCCRGRLRDAVCGLCLNLQVLPEFAGSRPLLGPRGIVPAASFKMKSLASRGNFSGSDARKFPQSEAALGFGVQTAPRTAVLRHDAQLVPLYFTCPFKHTGDPEPSITPPAAHGEGFATPAALLCLTGCPPRCLLPALVIYWRGRLSRAGTDVPFILRVLPWLCKSSAQLHSVRWLRPSEARCRSSGSANP